MKTLQRKRILGFTIIELMIVVMIVAILLAIAYPSYVQYVRKAKRGEAQQLLLNWSINQEIFRSNNITYDDGTNLPVPLDDNYDYTVSDPSPEASFRSSYLLQAAAKSGNDQENDVARGDPPPDCSTLTLDQNGEKLLAACWE
jgi:type IV pilus assembly protein PilE